MTKTASASRTDGGYYVSGCAIHRADRHEDVGAGKTRLAAHGGLVAFFSGLWVEQFPLAPFQIANFLNDRDGLPHVGLPAKAQKAERENRRAAS
jgi:hypothetical protein